MAWHGAAAISDLSLQGTAFYRDHAMEGGPLSPPQRHVMSSNDVHACAVGVDDRIHAYLHTCIVMLLHRHDGDVVCTAARLCLECALSLRRHDDDDTATLYALRPGFA